MKKKYQKPVIIVESFSPQEVLCACAIVNQNHAEYQQCGYILEGVGYTIFAQTWTACQLDGKMFGYCYQPGATNVFSS